MNRLAVVTGATGAIGAGFARRFSEMRHTRCYGLSRFGTGNLGNVTYIRIDLLKSGDIEPAIKSIPFEQADEIYTIHAIGRFAYEPYGMPLNDEDNDGVDDEVYASNVKTFINLDQALLHRLEKPIKLTECCIGSVSDVHQIPIFSSYYKSKNSLRAYIRDRPRIGLLEHMRGVFINISSCMDPNPLNPNTDKDGREYDRIQNINYWLTPEEVVERSIDAILNDRVNYQEIYIIKPDPRFSADYYRNIPSLDKKWHTETGHD